MTERLLSRLTGATFPETILFWDVESRIKSFRSEAPHVFRLGWACVRRERDAARPTREWVRLDAPEDFWRVLSRIGDASRPVWVVAHNLVYDFFMVGGVRALLQRGYKLLSVYNKGPTTLLRARNGKRKVYFVDSLNFFQGALAEWGGAIGLPKLKADLIRGTDRAVSAYCHRDVEILVTLFDSWIALVRSQDFGGLSVTVGSQSMTAFRHRLMKHSIYFHDNADVTALEREAYYGGRVECFRVGRLPPGRYTFLDVNSMYPYVMARNDYPTGLRDHVRGGRPAEVLDAAGAGAVVARVLVEVPRPVVPVRRDGKTLFPVGRFWTALTTPDLSAVARIGRILEVDAYATYDARPIFREFVREMYRLRQGFAADGKPLWSRLVKLMLNSLYGKFGQRSEEWRGVENVEGFPPGRMLYSHLDQPDLLPAICLGPVVWYCWKRGNGRKAFPAIAAHVTAYARQVLSTYINRAGQGHVYYVDTDSLLVDRAGLARLSPALSDSALGRLKTEGSAARVTIRCPKDYDFGEKKRLKGISKAARKNRDGSYTDIHWPKLIGLLGRGITEGYHTTVVRKRLTRTYDKGIVTASGAVEPFRLEEASRRRGESRLWVEHTLSPSSPPQPPPIA